MSRKPMSMEAVMDEERREVLALLNSRVEQTRRSSSVASMNRSPHSRSASPYTAGPRSPIRSMLDFVEDDLEAPPSSPSRNRSPKPATAKPIRSMLDIDCPSPALSPLTQVFSAQNSPTESTYSSTPHPHPRSMSDAAVKLNEYTPRPYAKSDRTDPTAAYQFSDIITNRENPMPKRALQPSNNPTSAAYRNNAVAELIRNAELGGLILPGGQVPLHGRSSGKNKHKSKSPHNRLGARSMSPQTALGGRGLSPAGRAFLRDEGLDMQTAYRRLSDANLMKSGGSLSALPMRKYTDGDGKLGRLNKDYLSPDGEELADTSDDDANYTSDDDEASRGRKAARSFPDDTKSATGANKNGRRPLTLLAAAEEERAQVASQSKHKYRSLLDEPEITVTNPSGEKVKSTKNSIHPANSFDMPSRSASRTPWDSDDEADYTDIKSAQKLSFTMTPIISTPEVERCIRIIYRGDFEKIQKEVTEEEHRRLRKYLVATDLSEESTHALEWTVGTVLRDGDTLVAVYCVDEETGIPAADGQEEPKTAGRDLTTTISAPAGKMPGIASLSNLATIATASNTGLNSSGTSSSTRPSLLMKHSDSSNVTRVSSSPGPQSQERNKAEEERKRAVQDITDRITRLLRKTRLQVRVIVEVLHCKNPRHLLTEVIDLLNPTMVILGSRGRSALKGVILGSFSNYLVTKSSAPVMVARKRLRKQGQYKRTSMNQVNNLSNPTARSLANAKID